MTRLRVAAGVGAVEADALELLALDGGTRAA